MRNAAVGGVALALAIVGWLLLNPTEPLDSSESSAQRSSGSEQSPPNRDPVERPSQSATPITSSTFDPEAVEPVIQEAQPRIEVAPLRGRTLRVVHKDTREPIAGAVVAFAKQHMLGSPEQRERYFMDSKGVADLIFRLGRHFRTNARGETIVPVSIANREKLVVAARKGDLFGLLDTRIKAHSKLVLEVTKGPQISVVVRDTNGVAVPNVLVSLRYLFGPKGLGMGLDIVKASTNAKGLAVLRDLQIAEMIVPGQMKAYVGLVLPLSEQVIQSFDPKDPPSEPIELTLPSSKPVTVEVRLPDGSPPSSAVTVSLARIPELHAAGHLPPLGAVTSQTNKSGDALFPRVGDLETWVIKAWQEEVPVVTEATHNSSEQSPIASVVRLTWDPKFPTYIVRLLGPDGQAVANAQISVSDQKLMLPVANLRSDLEGVISYAAKPSANAERSIELSVVGSVPPLKASCVLPPKVEGTHELGNLKLSATPCIASGTVFQPDGKPCADSMVKLTVELEPTDYQPGELSERMRLEHWSASAMTDIDGKFTVYGNPEGVRKFSVSATHRAFARSTPTITQPGATDLKLVLSPVGTLRARVKVPRSPLSKERFFLDLAPMDEDAVDNDYTPELSYSDGFLEAHWSGLPLGRYELSVGHEAIFADSPSNPLSVRVQDIVISAGDNQDSRLQSLDMERLFQVFSFDAFSESNEPIAEAFAEVQDPEFVYDSISTDKNGHVEVLVPRATATVRAKAASFTPKTIPANVANQRVTLSQAKRVSLVVTNLSKDLESAKAIFSEADGSSNEVLLARSTTPGRLIGISDELSPGTYRVRIVWAKTSTKDGQLWVDSKVRVIPDVTVINGAREQELSLDAAE